MNKARFEIVYSVAVLLVIPALIAFNTILLATSVRSDYDSELQTRAELANSVLAVGLKNDLFARREDLVAQKVNELQEAQNELKNISVVVKDGESFRLVASSDEQYQLSNSDELQFDIVYSRQWPVAKSIAAVSDQGTQTRAWNVATPIMQDDKVIGVVASDLLTSDVDEKFDATLLRSVIVMIISSIAVMVLLFNHFRFIGYARLLRKQQELNQTMSDFLSVATHELKAPMSIIKGYIANVTDGDFGEVSAPVKEQLAVASAQTDRLNELVQDLLNVSRIEQGRINFDLKPVNLTAVINMIVKNYQTAAQEKGIDIMYDSPAEQWIIADEGRVQEIFTNLIDNAVKYSTQGSVTVTHETRGKYVVTAVRDTGIGMSAEERQRLFQRFYRVKNDATKGISGTGLGLWIIKQYIEKMGGTIEVDSLVGSGSEFRVGLPSSPLPAP